MKFFVALSLLSIAGQALALPLDVRAQPNGLASLTTRAKGDKAAAAAAKSSTGAGTGATSATGGTAASGASAPKASAAKGAGAATGASTGATPKSSTGASTGGAAKGTGATGATGATTGGASTAASGGASTAASGGTAKGAGAAKPSGAASTNANAGTGAGATTGGNAGGAATNSASPVPGSGTGVGNVSPNGDPVMAATNFAKDANTVSASLNQLSIETDPMTIKSLAQRAFDAESDEDAQRMVLAQAAGSAGTSSNQKIMTSTPTVLDGLTTIMNNPDPVTAKNQVAIMGTERNSQILPSITQLSNAALINSNSVQRQQDFTPTVMG